MSATTAAAAADEAFWHRWLAPKGVVGRLLLRNVPRVQRAAFVSVLLLYPFFCAASWGRLAVRKLFRLKPAVVWGPTPILTIAESSAILRRLGYRSTTVVFTTYFIRQDFDVDLKRWIHHPTVGWWLPNALFLWALLKFDVFHFFFDGGLWSGMKIVPQARWLELPLLRLAGKRIIASAYGADVRIRSLAEKWQPINLCQECPAPGKHCICDTENGLINAKYHRDWCNVLLAFGDMHDFVFDSRKDFIYWPVDVTRIPFVGAPARAGAVKVVHSPNHRHFKGTGYVEGAVAALRKKGLDVDLVMVEGVSNQEAKRRYADADIVFAQCIAGWIGYTEIEAMAAGKPVISYLRGHGEMEHAPGCPVVSATPATLTFELERLVRDAELRERLGREGRQWVEREWSYEALAPRYDALHQEVWRRNGLASTLRDKWSDFFHGEARYRVGRPLSGAVLREYVIHSDPFLNLRRIAQGVFGQPPFDARGIPRMYYNGQYVEHPGVVALYALNAWHGHLQRPADADLRAQFFRAADWLRDRLEVDPSGVGRWSFAFGGLGRELPERSVCCFSQSLGVSILLRAEQVAPGHRYRAAADAAVELFRTPHVRGGLLFDDGSRAWLENASESATPQVRNASVTAAFALHEYFRATRASWADALFRRCVDTLKEALPDCDEQTRRLPDSTHILLMGDADYYRVQEMHALRQLTGHSSFRDLALRWSRALRRARASAFLAGRAPL